MFEQFGCNESNGDASYSRRVSLVVTLAILSVTVGKAIFGDSLWDVPPVWAVIILAPYGINKMAAAVKAIAEAMKR